MGRLMGTAVLVGMLVGASPAAANEYFVQRLAADTGQTCEDQFDPCPLTTALAKADSNPGRDRIQIDAAYVGPGPGNVTSEVELVGSGNGTGGTKFTNPTPGSSALILSVAGSNAQFLDIETTDKVGATLHGGTILDHVNVTRGGTTTAGKAVDVVADGSPIAVGNSSATSTTMPTGVALGVNAGNGTVDITDSVFEGANSGLQAGASGDGPTVNVKRTTTSADSRALVVFDGQLNVSSTVIKARPSAISGFSGIRATGGSVAARNNTLVGPNSGSVNSSAVRGDGGSLELLGSIARGFTQPAVCATTVTITDSDLQGLPATPCFTSARNVDVDPLFIDAAGGDYRLRADSPVIDRAGDTAPSAPESLTDRSGNARVLEGDGDGVPERDMGAFEFVPRGPTASVSASTANAAAGDSITFDGSASSDPDLAIGDALTYSWAFDDGAGGTGPTVQHAFTTPGTHTGTLTVRDRAGGTAAATATVTITEANTTTTTGTIETTGTTGTTETTGPPITPVVVTPIGPAFTGGLTGKSTFKLKTALSRGVGPFSVHPARPDWKVEATLLQGRKVVGRVTKRGTQPRTATLTVKLTSAARRAYKRKRSVKLTLRVVVSSASGDPGVLPARTVTLKR